MKAPTLKKTLYAALCLLLSSLVGLFLSELILRRFIPQPLYKWQQGLFESDPAVFYRLAKNFKAVHTQPEYSYAIRTNSYGFRGPEPRPDASVRVLILGDSFAFGQGVDKGKTLSSLIRAHFRGKGLDVDVLNTAVPGYSLMNEKRILERTLPTYRPHIVFAFFYWNDLIARGSLKVRNGYLVSDDRLSPRELRTFLNQNSHLFTLIKRFSYAFRSSPRNPRGGGHYRDEDVRAAARRLLEMKRLSEGSNARFRVFIIPWEGIGPGSAPWR
ncbi:MAG: SGNH/GDSL hydrolase family protein, partial [Nitrospinota bacterium]